METENKTWTPEVGKTAWFVNGSKIIQGLLTEKGKFQGDSYRFESGVFKTFIFQEYLFPTAEAALASIKVYDLEGKEVVITRASDKIIDEMCGRAADSIFNLSQWDDSDYAELGMPPIINAFMEIIAVREKAAIRKLTEAAFKMDLPPNPEGDARLKAAQEQFAKLGGGAANGGKSQDQREGGC